MLVVSQSGSLATRDLPSCRRLCSPLSILPQDINKLSLDYMGNLMLCSLA